MNCRKVENLLADYLSDNLDSDSHARAQNHLRRCPDCAQELSRMQRMIAEVGRLEKVSVPPDFLAQVHRKASSEKKRKGLLELFFVPFKLKIPLQLTAMAALGVLIFYMVPYQKRADETSDYAVRSPAPEVALKGETLEEEALRKPMPDQESLVPKRQRKSAEMPAPSAVAEGDDALATGSGARSVFEIAVVLRVTPEEREARAKPLNATDKEQPFSDSFIDRLKPLLESFDAVEIDELQAYWDNRRFRFKLPSKHYGPFMERLETLGVLEKKPPPLPTPPPESIVMDLTLVFD